MKNSIQIRSDAIPNHNNPILLRGVDTTPLMNDTMSCKQGLKGDVCEFGSIIRAECRDIFPKLNGNHFKEPSKNG